MNRVMHHPRRCQHQNRRLLLEGLENRLLLAGNVTATVSGGTLLVRGDGADNEVAIFFDEGSGEHVVVGLEDTTINGESEQSFPGVTNIDIDMKGGDDALFVTQSESITEFFIDGSLPDCSFYFEADLPVLDHVFISGFLKVRTGGGDDTVGLGVDAGGDVIVNTGDGDDQALVVDSHVGDDLLITTGNGRDHVVVTFTDVFDLMEVNGGQGVDEVCVHEVGAGLGTVNLGPGGAVEDEEFGEVFNSDFSGLLLVLGGQGADRIQVEGSESGIMTLDGGSGDDEIDADGVLVDGNLTVVGGAGNDDIEVEDTDELFFNQNVFVGGNLVVDAGAGDDIVDVEGGEFLELPAAEGEHVAAGLVVEGHLLVFLGAGNDEISNFDHLFIAGDFILNAGSGHDTETALEDDVNVGGLFHVLLGSGNDEFDASDVTAQDAIIDAGSGNDDVQLQQFEIVDQLMALMGSGDDELRVFASSAAEALFDGGRGFDVYFFFDNAFGRETRRNFEEIIEAD